MALFLTLHTLQQTEGIDSKINILIHSWMHKIIANEWNIDIVIASNEEKKQKK